MEPERWRRIEEVFQDALTLTPDDREALLRELRAEDPDLAREVESLVHSHQDAGSFLDAPLLSPSDETEDSVQSTLVGQRLGVYRIQSPIGHGGSSSVYRATREDSAYETEVAIKVLSAWLGTDEARGRFHRERQILATLDHPNIARLLDGGTTSEGLPYLVMELVRGEPLTHYCDRERLSVSRRLDLFTELCAAVESAHRSLIVHRDLKPANILVTADGVLKLLDFGIAKLLDPERFPALPATRDGSQVPLTPSYASPEQLAGVPLSTASDTYSLGLILFELLTGRPVRALADGWLPGTAQRRLMSRAIREDTGADGSVDPKEVAARRATTLGGLERTLRGDLDHIVQTALRESPEERYASVGMLREDLRRHREGLPIRARRPTAGYRLRKAIARNPWLSASLALVLVVLAAFAGTATWLARRTAQERDLARAERDRAATISRLLVDLFQETDPRGRDGEAPDARELIRRGSEIVGDELGNDPASRGTFLFALGRAALGLGMESEGRGFVLQGLESFSAVPDQTDGELAAQHEQAAAVLLEAGLADEGSELLDRGLDLARRSGDRRRLGLTLLAKGTLLAGKVGGAEAVPVLHEAADLFTELGDERHELLCLQRLAAIQRHLRQDEAAETNLRRVLALQTALFGSDEADLFQTRNDLANTLRLRGRAQPAKLAEAEAIARQQIEIQERVLTLPHVKHLISLNLLAAILKERDALDEAESLHRRVVDGRSKLLGPRHPEMINALHNLGTLLHRKGDLREAEGALDEAVSILRELASKRGSFERLPPYPFAALGRVLRDQGRASESLPPFRRALELFVSQFPADHPRVTTTKADLGQALVATGAEEAGSACLREAMTAMEAAPEKYSEPTRSNTRNALASLPVRATPDDATCLDLAEVASG